MQFANVKHSTGVELQICLKRKGVVALPQPYITETGLHCGLVTFYERKQCFTPATFDNNIAKS